MADLPAYFVTQTLLGGGAGINDRNKRFIHRLSDHSTVACFNDRMQPWTGAMAMELLACVRALNDAHEADRLRSERHPESDSGALPGQ